MFFIGPFGPQRSVKLTKKAQIVFKKGSEIVNTVTQHGKALDTHSKRIARELFWINTSIFGTFAAIFAGGGQTTAVDLRTTDGATAQARLNALEVIAITDPGDFLV